LLIGLASFGATPSPNSPTSSRSPTVAPSTCLFFFLESYAVSVWVDPTYSTACLIFLPCYSIFLYKFFIYANSSFTCLIELISSISST
jgi:hypothetical protein